MDTGRFDRTVRIVMWLDAFLSVAFVLVAVCGAPVLAALGMTGAVRTAVVITAAVSAVLLGVFGPIYAVLLMMRMHRGEYRLPRGLRVPLPPGMRPDLG